ncbi:hypothetical protein AB6A40_005176 [Gnathostoma spinigerum]|uniref:Dynactin subunit 2 n=1 Tax=Gnathostoma spinigerum TaxID=75299 RepID=A0ABD6EP59_9BILA
MFTVLFLWDIMSIQQEDVYETEDVPDDDDEVSGKETFVDSEDVELVHIDMDAAMKRYKGRLLSGDNVDFSDSITRKRRIGYGSGAYVLEVVGSASEEPETLEQKFQRLYCELNDLTEAVQQNKESEEKNELTFDRSDIQAMITTLKALQNEQDENSSDKHSGKPQSAQVSSAPKQTSMNEGRLANFEARLKRIEKAVGGPETLDEMGKAICREPLLETVEDLRMRLQLLQPTYADNLHERINQVLLKLRQLDDRKPDRIDGELQEKVNNLYEMMSKWDETCVGLSAAVKRMNGLQKLHEQAEQFSTKLSQLVGVYSRVSKTIENEEMALFDFRQQTAEALSKMSADVKKLEERVQALSK